MILEKDLEALANPTRRRVLEDVGLVEASRVGRWVVYTRDEERIRQFTQPIIDQLLRRRSIGYRLIRRCISGFAPGTA